MKKISFLFFVFCFLYSPNFNAQIFDLLDSNNVSISGTTYYVYGTPANIDHTKFNIQNLTTSDQNFTVKVRQEYSPYSNSHLMLCFDLDCFSASTSLFSNQTINNGVGDLIPANGRYDKNLDIRPATWMWNDCPNDSSIWHVIVYNQADASDTTSARIIYKCTTPTISTSVNESLSAQNFSVYPNPANSNLNFSSRITGRIYNVLGSDVLQFNNQSKIDISQLTKGVYFLKTDKTTTKVLKQ